MRVIFLNEPRLQASGQGVWWLLVEDFHVWIDEGHADAGGQLVTVPTGFATDLASVPRLPAAHLLLAGRARRSAILHDWLYEQRAPRAWADAVFRAAMAQEDVGLLARWAMWAGVRLGGARIYAVLSAPAADPFSPQ